MSIYSTEAILLAVRNFGEADKIATLFSKEYGKISAAAYGCRRPKNKLAGAMQIFSQLELSLAEGNNIDVIKHCEVKLSNVQVRNDLEMMAYGMFVAELIIEFYPDKQEDSAMYDLLLGVIQLLSQKNPRLVALAAGYQILNKSGCQPTYDSCLCCGKLVGDDFHFSYEKAGVVCRDCREFESMSIDLKIVEFINQLLSLDWQNPQSFTVNGKTLVDAEKLLIGNLSFVLEKPLKSIAFINQLTNLPK